jgi:ATP-dependent DNA ligase
VFEHACKMGLEGIVSKRLGSRHRSGDRRTGSFKKPAAPAVKREAEEDWGEPPRVRRRLFDLTHAAMAGSSSMA